jgi:GNAT superfamily N-acetyltransferase
MQADVRQAVLDDIDAVSTLLDEFRQFQGKEPNLSACRDFLKDRMNHGDSVVFLASLGPRPVGIAKLYPSYSTTALARVFILNDLYVNSAGRRAGTASALLSAVEAYAWSFGACRVSLNVAQVNSTAQKLYLARGWSQDQEFFMFHRFPPTP